MQVTVNDILNATKGKLINGSADTIINGFFTNSREIDSLPFKNAFFVPIIGERVDAHTFIPQVVEKGAKAFFIKRGYELPSNIGDTAAIEVEDTEAALLDTGLWYRKQFNIPFIGITGSVGKTTTKEMVAAALSSINVHKTKGNANSTIGLPLTLFGLEPCNEAAIIEMGISEFHEMEKLVEAGRPNLAIFTNVGSAHIGNLGSKENILKEKLHITDCFTEDSVLFINADDELLMKVATENSEFRPENVKHIVTFGINEKADFYASSIKISDSGTDFVANYKSESGEAVSEQIHLKTLGLHNVRNALAAIAVSLKLGISPAVSKKGLAEYKPLSGRGNIIKSNGLTIIDDTYNASPDSMKASVQIIGEMRGGTEPINRRFVVFADVLELGEYAETEHYNVGEYIKTYNKENIENKIDYLITVGKDSEQILLGVNSENLETNPVTRHFSTNVEAYDYLKSLLKKGDAIVVKGSRGMHTEEIVNALLNSE